MPNIKLSYLYRDFGNYKNYGEVIFTNSEERPVDEIEEIIRSKLLDGMWFYAHEWGLPDLHFEKYNAELDHGFHEFEDVSLTLEEPINGAPDINEFCEKLEKPDTKW